MIRPSCIKLNLTRLSSIINSVLWFKFPPNDPGRILSVHLIHTDLVAGRSASASISHRSVSRITLLSQPKSSIIVPAYFKDPKLQNSFAQGYKKGLAAKYSFIRKPNSTKSPPTKRQTAWTLGFRHGFADKIVTTP